MTKGDPATTLSDSKTTEVGSVADIVDNENTGLIVPAKNSEALEVALRRLVTSPKRQFRWRTRWHEPGLGP